MNDVAPFERQREMSPSCDWLGRVRRSRAPSVISTVSHCLWSATAFTEFTQSLSLCVFFFIIYFHLFFVEGRPFKPLLMKRLDFLWSLAQRSKDGSLCREKILNFFNVRLTTWIQYGSAFPWRPEKSACFIGRLQRLHFDGFVLKDRLIRNQSEMFLSGFIYWNT